jgi:flagellar hook-associated protein 3 FlgL
MINTSQNMLYHIGNLNSENERISYQLATGTNQNKGSENSILHSDLINLDDKLRVTEGLKLQMTKTAVINDSADSSMASLKLSLDNIKIDLQKGLNAGMQRSDKLALATNLEGIRNTMFDFINTRVDGEYVFTGSDTSIKPFEKDANFENNGQISFEGDGFLREVAVQPGSYRDRGITGYDVAFYTSSKAYAGESFSFEEGERIIDESGFEWKLNTAGDELQKYDYNGNIYHPLNSNINNGDITTIDVPLTTPGYIDATTGQYVSTTYVTDPLPTDPTGRVFEAKHNYFDDLNIIINALEGQATNADGTVGVELTDEQVRLTVSNGLEQTSDQFDATNIGHGELGGRNAVFENAYDTLLAQETNYNILIQQTGGADLAKLALESAALDLTYQSLYSTIGKMNELSLLNYLR